MSFNLFLSVLDLKPDQCVHMYDSKSLSIIFLFVTFLSGLIKLDEPVPVADDSNGKLMSICLPRSKKQPSHAQECAVSFLWETERGHTRKEVDTSALWYQNKQCSNIKQNVGSDRLLQCIQTTKGLRPKGTSSQVVYFFTCKTSGYWSVFGMSKYHNEIKRTKENRFSYFVTLSHYLNWIKDILYDQKPEEETL